MTLDAGRDIFWGKGTLKTQYGLVHKFARYKQFYKHVITPKNVNKCDITYKTDSGLSLSFFKNTGFVGMRAAVSSSLSGDDPDNWRPTIWISYWPRGGVAWGHLKEKRKKRNKQKATPWDKARISAMTMVQRGKHRARPKSRGGSAPCAPSAARIALTRCSGLPGAGAVVTTCLRKLGTTFGIVQYQKNAVPKAAVFRFLHGCEVDLYVKLSHSGLKS